MAEPLEDYVNDLRLLEKVDKLEQQVQVSV
jgi:hypothetical protein